MPPESLSDTSDLSVGLEEARGINGTTKWILLGDKIFTSLLHHVN